MPIYKVQKYDNPFVQIDKRILEDARLSWKAKGLLAYLLSKPHDWQVRTADIVKKATDGKTAVLTAITELINTGYATREQSHTEAGQWAETVYVITEVPQSGFPYTVKPYTDNPLHSNKDFRDNELSDSTTATTPDLPNAFAAYQNAGGGMGPLVAESIDKLIDECDQHILTLHPGVPGAQLVGDNWVTAAIITAVEAGARISPNYVKAILDRWKTEGYKSERKSAWKGGGSGKQTNLDKSNEALDRYAEAAQ